ncbi:hypothetical protein K8R47_03330 [archaeon]|nr:hypothetical protein [archaeon]
MKTKLPWGYNMIKISIKFWTNNLPKDKDVDDKTSWDSGVLTIPKNTHRKLDLDSIMFNSLEEIIPKLKVLLKRNGIKLVDSRQKVKFVE